MPSWPDRRQSAVSFARQLSADSVPHLAASLTYQLLLSLFPALVVVVALLGLIGLSPQALDTLLTAVGRLGNGQSVGFIKEVLHSVLRARGSGALLGFGIAGSIWTASSYIGAFRWAMDIIYGVNDRRSWLFKIYLQLGLAIVLLLFLALATAALAMSGPFARWLGDLVGFGGMSWTLLSFVRWPFLFLIALLMFWLLYRFTPGRAQPNFWRLMPGALAGVLVMLISSAIFDLYLAHFASYNKAYGTLGAVAGLLVWTWLLNIALLFGAEVNDALEQRRRRRLEPEVSPPAPDSQRRVA